MLLALFIGVTIATLLADNLRLYNRVRYLKDALERTEIEGQGFEQTTPDYDWYEDDVEYND